MTTPLDITEGEILWTPTEDRVSDAKVTAFSTWLGAEGIVDVDAMSDLWTWSVENTAAFWDAFRRWAGIEFDQPASTVAGDMQMPGAVWFPDATLNHAKVALDHDPASIALVHIDEGGHRLELSYAELTDQVARCAAGLRRLGVEVGDRVAGYLPSRIEAVVAFLATASLGAVWTACSPDFGAGSVLDRFRQVEPVVLLTVTRYRYGGRSHDRRESVAELVGGLPTVRAIVALDDGAVASTDGDSPTTWDELLSDRDAPFRPVPVPFDHPLWIVYTSGTTGLPKSIVHGHGGIVLEHHKLLRLHLDLGPEDTLFWFTTTGWVMWNIVVGALLIGATAVVYDGNPTHPAVDRLWQLAEESGATFLGLSAGYVHACVKEDLEPSTTYDLSKIRGVGITGSPLSPQANAWLSTVAVPEVFVASISGGTDVCTAFLGSSPVMPVRAGHIQHACLGVAARAFDDAGRSIVGQVGELVVTAPMPSMPLRFWADEGNVRYLESYFDMFPGVWRHGDWVRFDPDGSAVVLGRSDATLNRGGVRMGSSEFYAVLDTIDEIDDSLVIDTTVAGQDDGVLLLLVATSSGDLPPDVVDHVRRRLRSELSPRHVPDDVLVFRALPHTLNGKRLEVPIRRIFLGASPTDALDPSAIDDQAALDAVDSTARRWRARTGAN